MSATSSASCPIADPSIAVVTNVGVAHMEVFGSWEAIVDASAEPIEALRRRGPRDPERRRRGRLDLRRSHPCPCPVVRPGRGRGAYGPTMSSLAPDGLRVVRPGGRRPARAVSRSRCPASTWCTTHWRPRRSGLELDVPLAACASALSAARITPWRMETTATARRRARRQRRVQREPRVRRRGAEDRPVDGGGRPVDRGARARWRSSGAIAAEEHERVGELAARLHVDRLITIGPEAKAIAVAGVREGVEPENVGGLRRRR